MQAMTKRPVWLLSAGLANLFFLYVPIAVLIVFSFNSGRLTAAWQGFSLQWYDVLLSDEALWRAVQNSLVVGGASTLIATVLGVSAAVCVERIPFRRRRVLESTMVMPLVIPEIMMGVALMLFFVLVGFPLGLLSIIIGHTVMIVPVVMVIVRARLRKLDPRLEEAARDLGATPWRAFRRVTFPLLVPAVLGAVAMAFTVSLDDFIVAFFTAGPGSTTLPLKVYSMVKSGVSPEINALSALLVVISMGLVVLSLRLQRN